MKRLLILLSVAAIGCVGSTDSHNPLAAPPVSVEEKEAPPPTPPIACEGPPTVAQVIEAIESAKQAMAKVQELYKKADSKVQKEADEYVWKRMSEEQKLKQDRAVEEFKKRQYPRAY